MVPLMYFSYPVPVRGTLCTGIVPVSCILLKNYVPVSCILLKGTVSVRCILFTDTVSVRCILFTDTVSVRCILFTDTVSVNNLFLKKNVFFQRTRNQIFKDFSKKFQNLKKKIRGFNWLIKEVESEYSV